MRSRPEAVQGNFFADIVLPISQATSNPSKLAPRVPSSSSHKYDPDLATTQKSSSFRMEQPKRIPESQPGNMCSADSAPGDTQVVSQSVFDSLIGRNRDPPNQDSGYRNVDDMDIMADNETLVTLHEGDAGHIDLLAGFDDTTCPDANQSETHEDNSSYKLGESSPLHLQPDLFPESQRFMKTTPATALKQRNFDELNMVTPSSRNPLPSDNVPSAGIMALSQLFRSTQAPSSPLPNCLQSDPMSDRPSPAIPVHNPSLADTFSSPSMRRLSSSQRKLSEPQANYVTMKESQAERNKIIGERMTRSVSDIRFDEQSDDEFGREQSFIERQRRLRIIDKETSAQFAEITAPARLVSNWRERQLQEHRTSANEHVHAEELQGPNEVFQEGGTSEEETEQEDDIEPQALPSQELLVSSEEDKENYSGLSLSALSNATSAHGRLSQVLGLGDSPPRNTQPTMEPNVLVQHSRHSSQTNQVEEHGTSSQIIVRDSQQPAEQTDEENEGDLGTADGEFVQNTSQGRNSPLNADPSPRLDKAASSSVQEPSMQSSPPSKYQQAQNPSSSEQHYLATRDHHFSQNRSASPSSHISSTQLPRDTGNHAYPDLNLSRLANEPSQRITDILERRSRFEARDKSPSMPSRVSETPVHLFQAVLGDVTNTTAIPETSPRLRNRVLAKDPNGEMLNREDDGLPPVFAAHSRASLSQPSSSRDLSPSKNLSYPKLLSSPSGRQRRTLTQIAADVSPQIGPGQFDIDVGLFTAEDREFRALVGMSPTPPKKRRRGNTGLSTFASDPVLPVTPRLASPQFAGHAFEDEVAPAEQRSGAPVDRAEGSFRDHAKLTQRDTVWEVEPSPPHNVPRIPRFKRRVESSPLKQQSAQVERHEEHRVPPPVTTCSNDNGESTRPEGIADQNHQGAYGDDITENIQPTSASQIAPSQVLAAWRGQKRAYYPATCFGRPVGTSQTRYLVKFEDSDPVEVPIGAVKRLELRVGDAVKVDMPNVPKVTHIVRGFADKLSAEEINKGLAEGLPPMTDMYGHSTVILGPKQRRSLPNGGVVAPGSIVRVPISRIYLDTILWNQLKGRGFTVSSETALSESKSRLETPSDGHSIPATPSTRPSRSINYFRGIFAGMVFAVSFLENEEAKTHTTRLILENDGHILKEGFNELFEFPSSVPLADPSKTRDSNETDSEENFRLTSIAEEVGFACVIADKHSRREKYMQALALNLPCLSWRWIEDCVAQSRILDWEMYLLPAGESMYLDGATKSRILPPNPASIARLSETITARPMLFKGQSVLLVMGRGRAEEKRKAYIFLTYALGASKVERVFDLKAAKALLDQQANSPSRPSWDIISVDDSEQAAARSLLLGTPEASDKPLAARSGKKRKKSDLMDSVNVSANVGGDPSPTKRIRVAGNEFICQSLILGKMFDS